MHVFQDDCNYSTLTLLPDLWYSTLPLSWYFVKLARLLLVWRSFVGISWVCGKINAHIEDCIVIGFKKVLPKIFEAGVPGGGCDCYCHVG